VVGCLLSIGYKGIERPGNLFPAFLLYTPIVVYGKK
jgi:hypothetical protein